MRAILIDPELRAFTEIQISEDFRDIQAILKCRSFTNAAFLNGSMANGFDAIYASDDHLGDRDNPRFWFQVDTDRAPPSSHPIAGLGLAHGVGTEGDLSAKMVARGEQFTEGEIVELGGKFPVKIINANKQAQDEYTIQAGNFYGHDDYHVQRVLIPDRRGRFPDNPRCDASYRMPILAQQ